MRLLDTTTLELHEFFDGDISKYAILSHRWQKQELTFKDMKPKYRVELPSKPGYDKVNSFCRVAREDGHDWGWVDTCCT